MNYSNLRLIDYLDYTDTFISSYNQISISIDKSISTWTNNTIYKFSFYNNLNILLLELKLSQETIIDLHYVFEDYISFNFSYSLSYEFYSENIHYFLTVIYIGEDNDNYEFELCIIQNCINSNNIRLKLNLSYDELVDFIYFIDLNIDNVEDF